MTRATVLRLLGGTAAGILLGGLLAWAGSHWLTWSPPAPFHLPPAAARALLVGVLGALFTLAAFAFWMRTVAVNLVAGAMSSAVLARYLGDRFQANLLVATAFAVAFVSTTLAGLPDRDGAAVPLAGVVLSVLLTIASLAALLYAMTHSLAAVDVSRIVRAITTEALAHLGDRNDPPVRPGSVPDRPPDHVLLAPDTGWARQVDPEALLAELPPSSCVVVEVGAGNFVMAGTRIGHVWHGPDTPVDVEAVLEQVRVMTDRSQADDVVFAIDQIVDIGSRALRARARDMTLAREAIGHLGLLVLAAMDLEASEPRTSNDGSGALVEVADHRAWPDLARRAFEPLRIDGARWPVVAQQLLSTLGAIHERRVAQADEPGAEELRRLARSTIDECQAGAAIEADVRSLVDLGRRLGLLDDA